MGPETNTVFRLIIWVVNSNSVGEKVVKVRETKKRQGRFFVIEEAPQATDA